MNTLQHMEVVLAIAEKGSLTAAANDLDTSLPTVVRILAAAETHLGVRLFDRTTRRLRITEEGELYLATCRRVLEEIRDIENSLRERHTEPVGGLTLTAPVLFGRLHVSPVLNAFITEFPRVSAKLILLDRAVDLVEEGIDIAVRIGPVNSLDLVATPIGQVRRVVCATPQRLAQTPITSPKDLEQAPFVQSLSLVPGHELSFQHGPNKSTRVALKQIRVSSNNNDVVISACLDHLGVGVFLSYQVQHLVAEGRLQVVLEEFEPVPLPVSLLYSPSRRLSARMRAFIKWAKDGIGERLQAVNP